MNSVTEYRFFRPADLLIPVFLLMVILIAGSGGTEGNEGITFLEVHAVDCIVQHPLPADTVFAVQGNLGPLQVEISGGRARVLESPCQGQDCVNRGWLGNNGDLAVCVPSGVFLVIGSGDGEQTLDAVSY